MNNHIPVTMIVLLQNTHFLLTGGMEKILRIYDLNRPDAPPREVDKSPGSVRTAAWLHSDQTILSSCTDIGGVRYVLWAFMLYELVSILIEFVDRFFFSRKLVDSLISCLSQAFLVFILTWSLVAHWTLCNCACSDLETGTLRTRKRVFFCYFIINWSSYLLKKPLIDYVAIWYLSIKYVV